MLTSFDKELLNLLQSQLPLTDRPFADLAGRLGSDEQTVLSRLKELKAAGYIRRVGAFFDSAKLGYGGTLVALKVEPERLPEVAQAINSYPGVTHNYERESEYNLWFTLLTPQADMRRRILSEVGKMSGVKAMMDLPAQEKYKINVQFALK